MGRPSRVALVTSIGLAAFHACGATACKEKHDATRGGASDAQTPPSARARLPFRIVEIHERRVPTLSPPFHVGVEGGTWTFVEATTEAGVPFGFGFETTAAHAQRMTIGAVLVTVPDAAAGRRFVQSLADTFHGKLPPERPSHGPAPQKIRSVFLAVDAQRDASGAFAGSGGGWYASQLFPQSGPLDAEVYLNFNLKERKGELAEKDRFHADALVAYFAEDLRDGPRGAAKERTPETDPRLAPTGPRIVWTRTVEGDGWGMSPAGDRYLLRLDGERGGSRVVALALDHEEQTELFRVPHRLASVACAAQFCVAVDRVQRDPRVIETHAPSTVWLFDTKKKSGLVVKGAWGSDPAVPLRPWAPDGSYFVVGAYRGEDRERQEVLYLVGRDGKVRGPVDLGRGHTTDVMAVTPSRIVVRLEERKRDEPGSTWVSIDAATLAVAQAEPVPYRDDLALSPDGKRGVTCRDDGSAIVVKELPDGPERVFAVHEDDRGDVSAHCPIWAGPKRLEYRAKVRGWLDVDTLEIGGSLDEGVETVAYDATGTWAVEERGRSVRIGKVESP